MTGGVRSSWSAAGLALVFLAAYRALWWPEGGASLEQTVFAVGSLPGPLVLAVAGWLALRRTRSLVAHSAHPADPGGRAGWIASAVALIVFAWAVLADRNELQFLSLASAGLACAAFLGGPRMLRAQLLPAAVLAFGLAIPRPLESEIVWRLQLWTARWSGDLLVAMGREFRQAGVILRDGSHTFHVIDTCSGLTAILILLLVALLVSDLLDLDGRRSSLLVALTPAVGFLVNVVRVAYIAGSPSPEELAGIGADHTLQGVAVLMLGTLSIYGLGWMLARPLPSPAPSAASPASEEAGAASHGLRFSGALAIALLGLSLLLPSLARTVSGSGPTLVLPDPGPGWSLGEAAFEPFFDGIFQQRVHRRYESQTERAPLPFMDVLIGRETSEGDAATRSFSAKRFHPGPDWDVLARERERNWILDREVDVVVAAAAPDGEHAVVVVWRVGHAGVWLESLRLFLGLDRLGPAAGSAPPVLVKLVAYSPHAGPLMLDRAKQRIDRFILEHREALLAIR